MIAEFTIENFLSIRSEQKISFVATRDLFMSDEYYYTMPDGTKLLKLGIIYGANASGKTNILNALDFFKHIMTDAPLKKSDEIDAVPFLLDNNSKNEHTLMGLVFYLNEVKHTIKIEYDNQRIYSESLIVASEKKPITLYKRNYDEATDSSVISFSLKLGLSKDDQKAIIGNTINNCSVLAAFGKSNVQATRMNDVFEYLDFNIAQILAPSVSLSSYVKRKLIKDDDRSLKRFLIEILKLSDFNINDMEIKSDEIAITPEMEDYIAQAPILQEAKDETLKKGSFTRETLVFQHHTDAGLFTLPEDLESRGTMRFLGMGVILRELLKKDRFIAIDEIESSIHYELLGYFIKLFVANSEKHSQLLCSTHDVNLLDENFIRRDTVWFTDKSSDGETIVSRLSDSHLHKNISPYNAYRQGKLVKLPFLGSLYLDKKLFDDEK